MSRPVRIWDADAAEWVEVGQGLVVQSGGGGGGGASMASVFMMMGA